MNGTKQRTENKPKILSKKTKPPGQKPGGFVYLTGVLRGDILWSVVLFLDPQLIHGGFMPQKNSIFELKPWPAVGGGPLNFTGAIYNFGPAAFTKRTPDNHVTDAVLNRVIDNFAAKEFGGKPIPKPKGVQCSVCHAPLVPTGNCMACVNPACRPRCGNL